jgi:plasmid stabilization system protein ParE
MNVRYTEVALRELDDILAFIASNYPTALQPFQRRLRAVEK